MELPDEFELTNEVIHEYLLYLHAQTCHKMPVANFASLYVHSIQLTAGTPALYTPEMFITLFAPACHL